MPQPSHWVTAAAKLKNKEESRNSRLIVLALFPPPEIAVMDVPADSVF
jgi:hypothetical protein